MANEENALKYQFIPAYLFIKNDFSRNDSNKLTRQSRGTNRIRVHFLVLEGSSDKTAYVAILSNHYKHGSQDISLSLSDRNMILPSDYRTMVKEYLKKDPERPNNVEYVKELIDYFNSHCEEYLNIDYYGFIDRDYHHDIKGRERISETTEHDLETNLIRCYFDMYFNEKIADENKDMVLDLLTDALLLTTKQGVLGKISTLFVDEQKKKNPNYDAGKLIYYCHSFFKKGNYLNESRFCFDDYLEKTVFASHPDFQDRYKEKKQERKYATAQINRDTLKEYLKVWLEKRELKANKPAKSAIQKCLEYSNGHMLIEYLVTKGKSNEYFQSEKQIMDDLIGYAKTHSEEIHEICPLQEYKEWRIQHNYYQKESKDMN